MNYNISEPQSALLLKEAIANTKLQLNALTKKYIKETEKRLVENNNVTKNFFVYKYKTTTNVEYKDDEGFTKSENFDTFTKKMCKKENNDVYLFRFFNVKEDGKQPYEFKLGNCEEKKFVSINIPLL